jgi:DNA invertase Pin-like site-specific DNA recombinase
MEKVCSIYVQKSSNFINELEKIIEYTEKNNLIIYKIYVDYDELFDDIKKGLFSKILVWNFWSLGNSVKENIKKIDLCRALDVRINTIEEKPVSPEEERFWLEFNKKIEMLEKKQMLKYNKIMLS